MTPKQRAVIEFLTEQDGQQATISEMKKAFKSVATELSRLKKQTGVQIETIRVYGRETSYRLVEHDN